MCIRILSCLVYIGLVFPVFATEPRPAGGELVNRVLAKEASGIAVDRRSEIPEAYRIEQFDHWQVGELEKSNRWTPFTSLNGSDDLQDYESQRGAEPLDADQHRQLAKWCKRHKMVEQERAHWYGVLLTLPEDTLARQALGHEKVGDRWFSREELRLADERAVQLQVDLEKWIPKLRKLVNSLQSPNSKTKQAALDVLAAIDEPSAISALEITSCGLPADLAIPFIKAISRFRSKDACLALTRIAVAFPDESRGSFATTEMKSYAKEFYVPELLALLSTPIETTIQYSYTPKGDLLIQRAMFRETKDEKQSSQLERVATGTHGILLAEEYGYYFRGGVARSKITPIAVTAPDNERSKASKDLATDEQNRISSNLAKQNAEIQTLDNSIYRVLAQTTGEVDHKTPHAWWQWWQDYNYRTAMVKHQRSYRASLKDSEYDYSRNVLGRTSYFSPYVLVCSCLVAGTEVQTSGGLKAIDKVQIGDLVIAQDAETGELALKAVVQTTIRPPMTTIRIITESGEIQATAGHRWFVAGRGWLKTHELEPDMLLHNATGTTRVVQLVEDSKEQKVYNLVVEGYHSYFVGKDRVLSFDNSEITPTLRAVPGYGQIAKN